MWGLREYTDVGCRSVSHGITQTQPRWGYVFEQEKI